MYHVDGDFGKVRLAQRSQVDLYESYFNCITLCGWHNCNDKYCINRLHGNDDTHLLFYTVSGEGILEMNGKVYSLTAKTTILVPARTPVRYYTAHHKLWEFYWIHFKGKPCQPLLDFICKQEHQLITFNKYSGIQDLTEYALADKQSEKMQSIIQTSFRLSQILYKILETQSISYLPVISTNTLSSKAIAFIEQNYQKGISIHDISQKLYISNEHLIRSFKKEVGKSPYRYLMEFRIEKSKSLLSHTNIPISEIALLVGFTNNSNYAKQFKAMTNISPISYRIGKTPLHK